MSITMLSNAQPLVSEVDVLSRVRAAFVELAAGRAVQPAQVVTDLPDGGDVIAYQAVLADAGVYAVKVSPYLPQEDAPPVVTAWTMLLSTRTGQPVLLADSAALTAERTAATSALAIDLLARPDARRLALVGTGPLGRAHLRYARLVRPFDHVRVFAPDLDDASAAALGSGVRRATSADDAARDADVVLLCTSAAEPVVDVTALAPGTLVTSISTNAPMAHEIDPAALARLDVYCDNVSTCLGAAGDFRLAARDHGFGAERVRGDLPRLLIGTCLPPSGERVTYFRSIGLGIEDAAVALAALDQEARA